MVVAVKIPNKTKRMIDGLAGEELIALLGKGITDGLEAFFPAVHPAVSSTLPSARTGEVDRSWSLGRANVGITQSWKKNTRGQIRARYGSRHPAARILELGGTVRPKRGKYLAQPARPEAENIKPRDVEGLVPMRMRDGDLFLGRRTSWGVELWFKLVSEHRVEGTHYLYGAAIGLDRVVSDTSESEVQNAFDAFDRRVGA